MKRQIIKMVKLGANATAGAKIRKLMVAISSVLFRPTLSESAPNIDDPTRLPTIYVA